MDLFSNLHSRQTVGDFSEKAYLTYSMYVILDRALPHISDGLKPVQRRIIFAMSEIGLSHLSKYKKSARTVGDVLGKYHPHGDSACYEAMVLMAQNFSYRYPFIDGQGNWGSIDDPKSFAAMRYTESRLSKYAVLLLKELKQGTVDWVKNFDGTMDEPKLLPAQVPNILLNGAMGIAVGMSTYIPPHNITEIMNACLYVLSNEKATIDDVMDIVIAPDYPSGANIISTKDEIAEVYRTGSGSIKQRAVYEIAKNGNVIISKLPHQASSSNIMEQIANQLKQQKITWIKNIQDESDDRDPVRIILYSGTTRKNIDKLMGHLFASTDLEKSFRINMNMIGLDNRPKVKNLLDIINEWLVYRKHTLRRRLTTSLDKVLARLHILDGLLTAFLNIDEVIEIIRNFDDPGVELQSRFSLSEIQSEAILNIRLRKLAKIEEIEIRKEQSELLKDKEILEGYLNSPVKFKNLLKKEFKQVLTDFGDERRSNIISVEKSIALEEKDLIPNEKVTVMLSKAGWIRCAKGDNIDPIGFNYKPEDKSYLAASGNSNIKIIVFTKLGKSFSMYVDKLPSARGYGDHITTYFPIDSKDEIIGMSFVNAGNHILLASSEGKGFVTPADNLVTNKVTGKNIFDVDNAVVFKAFDSSLKAVVVSYKGRVIVRNFDGFSLLNKGKGKSIIKLDKNDKLKYVEFFDPDKEEVVLTAGKRFIRINKKNISEYFTDKSSCGGVLLPQGFRSITKSQVEDK